VTFKDLINIVGCECAREYKFSLWTLDAHGNILRVLYRNFNFLLLYIIIYIILYRKNGFSRCFCGLGILLGSLPLLHILAGHLYLISTVIRLVTSFPMLGGLGTICFGGVNFGGQGVRFMSLLRYWEKI